MRLFNRADGVSGHFCIGRYNESGKFWEFYNNGKWCSAGHVYVGKECAAEAMEKISNSTQPRKGKIMVVNAIGNNIVIHLRNVIGLHVGDCITVT